MGVLERERERKEVCACGSPAKVVKEFFFFFLIGSGEGV